MEKLSGVPLDRVWGTMDIKDRLSIVKVITRHQKAWMSFSFKQFGSLYYAQDLNGHAQGPLYDDPQGFATTNSTFAVGPSTGRELTDDGRASVEFDRGPCKTLEQKHHSCATDATSGNTSEEYHLAIGYREIACVGSLSQLPRSPLTLCGPGTYQPTREKKMKALHCYLAMVKYLLPTDQLIQSSFLGHDDLHVENILVNPEHPTEVTGIIDWQSTEWPLFSATLVYHIFLTTTAHLRLGWSAPSYHII